MLQQSYRHVLRLLGREHERTAGRALALAALAYLPFWRGPEVLTIVRRGDLYTTSLPAVLYAWLQPRWGTARTTALLGGVAALLTALFAIGQGLRAWRDRSWRSLPRAAFEIALFYLLFTCLWFQEWYTIWPVALAALLPVEQAVALAVMLNYVGLTKPLVFGPLWLWRRPLPPLTWREVRLGPAVLAVPWLSTLARLVQRRRARTPGAALTADV